MWWGETKCGGGGGNGVEVVVSDVMGQVEWRW